MPISDTAVDSAGATAPEKQVVFTVAYGGFLEGEPRSATLQAIGDLRRLGIKCFLITGLSKGDLLEAPELGAAFDGYCLEGGAQWGSWENLVGPANAHVVMAAADRAEQAGVKVQRRRASFTCGLDALEAVQAVAGECLVKPRRDIVNVLPPGLDKGLGLEAILGQFGMRAAHAVCLAATEDDVPLLESADIALVPADADAPAKQAADAVLASTGAAAVLEACARLARGDWRPTIANARPGL